MNELAKIKERILRRLDRERFIVSEAPNEDEEAKGIFMRNYDAIRDTTAKSIINEEINNADDYADLADIIGDLGDLGMEGDE